MNDSSPEVVPVASLHDEHVERFIRIYGSTEIDITPALDGQFRDRIAPGNHARVLLDDVDDIPDAIDALTLKQYVTESDNTIEQLMASTTRSLVNVVKEAWSRVPKEENLRSSGLLNTLCEARDVYRQRLQEIDGTEESGQTISGALEDTAWQIEDWLRTPGRYIMRPRRIKAKILSQQEALDAFERLRQHPEGSPEGQREIAKLAESAYRLCRHIAVTDFLLQGKLPNVVSVDDLANEAVEYTIGRIKAYDAERGIKFSSWAARYMRHFYRRKISELANPIYIPQNQLETLVSANPAIQIGNARIINESVSGSGSMRQAWLALGRNVLRLDGDDGPTDSDHFITDPEGPEQNIPWQELVTDYHRLHSQQGDWGALWPGHGTPDSIADPGMFAAQSDLTTVMHQKVNEILDERRRQVVELYFGLDGAGPKTGQEVANILGGMGRARAQQLVQDSLVKLRTKFLWDPALKHYYAYVLENEASADAHLGNYDPHKGQPNFPEYIVGEATSEEVLESVRSTRRQQSGAVDPSLWEW